MSIVILGGNECMTRRYCDLCRKYNCKAKVYPKFSRGGPGPGQPGPACVLFTGTMSTKCWSRWGAPLGGGTSPSPGAIPVPSRALRQVLETHVDPGPRPCPEP